MTTQITFVVAAFFIVASLATATRDLEFKVLNTTIPKALSDHSASVHNPHGTVYLAGGCDDPNGNTYVTNGTFVCNSISASTFKFDTVTQQMVALSDMPRARYRHASAILNNQLWILGGRTILNDTLIPEIDLYDIGTNTWSTIGNLTLPKSDLAAFADENFVYIVGGYTDGYIAQSQLLLLQYDKDSKVLTQNTGAALEFGRGDITAATDGTVAYISGGWTDINNFCVPLGTVEQYTIATNQWTTLPDVLNTPRADKALVLLNGRLVALGGETSFDEKCPLLAANETTDLPLWEQTVAVDDVEVLEGDKWVVISELHDFRFRFAAVSVDAEDTIYTFGGQQAFNATCNCFRTSNEIVAYKEVVVSDPPTMTSGASLYSVSICSMTAVIVMVMF